jgi:hypothetical protein
MPENVLSLTHHSDFSKWFTKDNSPPFIQMGARERNGQ